MLTHQEPPLIQAEDHWNAETRMLTFSYGSRDIIAIHIPGTGEPSYRRDSDGTLNSIPFIQQIYVMLDEKVTAEVTMTLSAEAIAMRPKRAQQNQAILGQVGRPLPEGVNGLYDIAEDYLVSWYGRPWQWESEELERDGEGNLVARMTVELGPWAWFINFKPHMYRMHYGYRYHEPWNFRPNLEPISGWCSWEAHRRNVNQENVEQAANFCAEHFMPYGLKYLQLDDGFQKMPLPAEPEKDIPQAWLDIDRQKFPEQHPGIVKGISDTGLEPGIWTSVSIYNDEFPKHHPECLVQGKNGEPLLGDWIKYLIDCTPETLAAQVTPYYKKLAEMGYTYFKTDVTRHLFFDGFHHAVAEGSMTNQEATDKYRAFLGAARAAIGPDKFWLLSWGVMMEGAGYVDACRISMDALPTWSGLRMQIIESARWWHTHRIVWQNDPDHVCVRAKKEWVRSVLSTVSLTGQLFMLSDAIEEYEDPERVHMIQRCLPPLTTMPGETGQLDDEYTAFTWTKFHGFGVLDDPPYSAEDMGEEEARAMAGWAPTMDDEHPMGSLWAFHMRQEIGEWCVVLRTAVLPLKESKVTFEQLGLEPGEYAAFDFWKQEYLGRMNGSMECSALALGHCQVIALRKVIDTPQLLSSSRHVSQDAVSVRGQKWAEGVLTLEIEGIPNTKETYWIHVPNGEELTIVEVEGMTAELKPVQTEAVAVEVTFIGTAAKLSIRY
jgi:hypothetical protein